jgi:putative hydrolase of the HAD superfamily
VIPSPEAVLLDIGGVFHLPRRERVVAALADAGLDLDGRLDDHGLHRAHHVAIARFDARPGVVSDLLDPDAAPELVYAAYDHALAVELGVPDERLDAAIVSLARIFGAPGGWGTPVPGSTSGLEALAGLGLPLGVVSNSDGTLEDRLREEGVMQVGPGPGVEMGVIVDSGAIGAYKPDPRIFEVALERLGIAAENAVHVGDSVAMDVVGALAAGVTPIHLDPFGDCPGGPEHEHVRSLEELAERLRR